MKEKSREGPLELAVYGKGGIGKSTVSANLSAALAMAGQKVLQIGCDPKHDSTRLLMGGELIPTVLDYLHTVPAAEAEVAAVLRSGAYGIGCIEAGGPQPGVGCAGRGIITAFEFLEKHRVKAPYDLVVYDVLGDVVCGGFAVPVRREYADAILLVTSGEYMAIYAANNILRGIRNFDGDSHRRVAGILFNRRNLTDEEGRVQRFAEAVGLPIVAELPRSPGFAHAEEQRRTLMELEGYEEEKEVFRSLARRIIGGLDLCPARPLSDEELEQTVLGTVSLRTQVPVRAQADEAPKVKAASAAPAEKPRLDRPPLYGCAFNGAASTAVHLTDALVIAHSPRACAFYTWQNISSPGRKNLFNRGILMPSAISPHFECSDMDHASAVFGGLEKLRGQVQAALERKPGAVIVISSCVSGIIGDDIRSLEALSTPETPVIAIPADGDISGDYAGGIRDCLHILAEKLIDRGAQQEKDCVNLVGELAISYNNEPNVRALRGLLSGLGLRLNCRFLGDARCEELRGFLKAPLNILDSESADNLELKDFLQREFGCRFLPGHLPVGMEATAAWVREFLRLPGAGGRPHPEGKGSLRGGCCGPAARPGGEDPGPHHHQRRRGLDPPGGGGRGDARRLGGRDELSAHAPAGQQAGGHPGGHGGSELRTAHPGAAGKASAGPGAHQLCGRGSRRRGMAQRHGALLAPGLFPLRRAGAAAVGDHVPGKRAGKRDPGERRGLEE